jgi:hypothetical protein
MEEKGMVWAGSGVECVGCRSCESSYALPVLPSVTQRQGATPVEYHHGGLTIQLLNVGGL